MNHGNYEDLFENIDDDFLEQLYDHYVDKFQDTPDPATPELDARMQRIFAENRRKQQRRRTWKKVGKLAAVFAIVIAMTSASILSVDAWRVQILNMWISFGEQKPQKETRAPSEELAKIPAGTPMPSFLPDNYMLDSVETTVSKIAIMYIDTKEVSLIYEVYPSDSTVYGKASTAENSIAVKVNGWSGYCLVDREIATLVWNTNDNIFRISGSVDRETLLEIAESVK